MLSNIGVGLIVAGVIVAIFGDRNVSETKGFVGKIFTWPPGRANQLKVVIGIALIFAGFMLIIAKQ